MPWWQPSAMLHPKGSLRYAARAVLRRSCWRKPNPRICSSSVHGVMEGSPACFSDRPARPVRRMHDVLCLWSVRRRRPMTPRKNHCRCREKPERRSGGRLLSCPPGTWIRSSGPRDGSKRSLAVDRPGACPARTHAGEFPESRGSCTGCRSMLRTPNHALAPSGNN